MMQYQVHYLRKKKKNYSKQVAGNFLTIEDAVWYESLMKERGCEEIQIVPVF